MGKIPMGWQKSLVVNKKNKNRWCKGNHSPPPTSRLVPSQSPSNSYFGRNFLPTTRFYCWVWWCWSCMSLLSPGAAVLAISPLSLFAGVEGRAEWETEAALMLCNHSSVTVVFCQHCFGHKYSTIQVTMEKADSTLARANTGHEMQFGRSSGWLYHWASEGASAVSKVSGELSLACSDSSSLCCGVNEKQKEERKITD